MGTIQSIFRNEYQFVDTTKEQRVKQYEEMATKENGFLTVADYDARVANGDPIYFTFQVDDDVAKINLASKGDKELTEDQKEYLKKTYDMDNLSKDDKLKLLSDLSCFGVISGKEALGEVFMLNYQRRIPDGWTFMGEIQTEASDLRGVTSFQEWLGHYGNTMNEQSEELKRLMSDPYADILTIQSAQSKQNYYSKMCDIINLISEKKTTKMLL